MIKEVILKNFQKHEHIKLSFTKGCNLILGETGDGKSAIVRALYLAIMNQPRNAEKEFKCGFNDGLMEITIITDDNHKIKRKKKKYYLNNSKKPLQAFGANIPEPVKAIFPFTENNWQYQFDSPFLIFQTGGSASNILNSSTGLKDQEDILKLIKSDISEHNSNIKRLVKNNQEHKKTIENLHYVPELLLKAKSIQKLIENFEYYEENIYQINYLCNNILQHQEVRKKSKVIDKFLIQVENIIQLKNQLKEMEEKYEELYDLYVNLLNTKHLKSKFKIYDKLSKSIIQYESILNEEKEIKNQILKLESLINNIIEFRKQGIHLTYKIKKKNKEFNSLLFELGECPLCGSKFKKGKHKC